MLISLDWLKDYINIRLNPDKLAEILTMSGVETEVVKRDSTEASSGCILEISLTPNRADCYSHIGVAREIAAITGAKVKYPPIKFKEDGGKIEATVSFLNKTLCRRYAARVIKGIEIKESPEWMKKRLHNVNIRSINNVVDATNYVMMEYGQPLHAFDLDLLEGNKIVVKNAKEGETFTALDDSTITLDDESLMICDGKKPVALAGIMGGANSQVTESTKNILLESAYFQPMNIRKTSKRVGLRSESSQRFEKGIDPDGIPAALNRLTDLIVMLAGGKVNKGIIDKYPTPLKSKKIPLRMKKLQGLIGRKYIKKDVKKYLKDLNMKVSETSEGFSVIPPSYRVDIKAEVDLIEEVARLSDYDKIPSLIPVIDTFSKPKEESVEFRKRAKALLIREGFLEAINYSFIPERYFKILYNDNNKTDHTDFIKILNPLSEEESIMRTSLIPGLVRTFEYNINRSNFNLRIFEEGKVFIPAKNNSLPEERNLIAGLLSGNNIKDSWDSTPREVDFYDIKGIVENLLAGLYVPLYEMKVTNSISFLHPGRAALIFVEKQEAGYIGQVHPHLIEKLGLKESVFVFEISLDLIEKRLKKGVLFESLPRFPGVQRDISMIIDGDIDYDRISGLISLFKSDLLKNFYIFDLYRGENIPSNKKSIAVRVEYQAKERTLVDEEVDIEHQRLISELKQNLNAEIRAK